MTISWSLCCLLLVLFFFTHGWVFFLDTQSRFFVTRRQVLKWHEKWSLGRAELLRAVFPTSLHAAAAAPGALKVFSEVGATNSQTRAWRCTQRFTPAALQERPFLFRVLHTLLKIVKNVVVVVKSKEFFFFFVVCFEPKRIRFECDSRVCFRETPNF